MQVLMELIANNNIKQNQSLFVLIEDFLKKLNIDRKTQLLYKHFNISYWLIGNDDIVQFFGIIIKKQEVLEFIRMRFLSVIFIKDLETKFNVLNSINSSLDYDKWKSTANLLDYMNTYPEIKGDDTNNFYLYSDNFGLIVKEALEKIKMTDKDIVESLMVPTQEKFIINKSLIDWFIKWLNVCNTADHYILLFVLFSIKKKERHIVELEEIINFVNLAQLADFIINGELICSNVSFTPYISNKMKDFNYWLNEGYLNRDTLIEILTDLNQLIFVEKKLK